MSVLSIILPRISRWGIGKRGEVQFIQYQVFVRSDASAFGIAVKNSENAARGSLRPPPECHYHGLLGHFIDINSCCTSKISYIEQIKMNFNDAFGGSRI